MKKNLNIPLNKLFKRIQTISGLAILITAAVLMEVTGIVQYIFARNGIREEVQQRAVAELQVKNLEIQKVVNSVETAVGNTVWALERAISNPDSIYAIEKFFIANNPIISGCAIAFEPGYYHLQDSLFEPFTGRDGDNIVQRQIASSNHDYTELEWYVEGLKHEDGYWTEPYLDNAGSQAMVCSYTMPIHDATGRVVGVFCTDVTLNWLVDMFGELDDMNASSVLASREGRILSCPDRTMVMNTTIHDATSYFTDSMVNHINNAMLAGDSGSAVIRDNNGDKGYVYYAPVKGGTGWSMAVIFPDKDIYRGLRQVGFNLMIMMLLGCALLAFIMYRTVKNLKKLHTVSTEKERVSSELHIAGSIQMGMLPKTFPPYPNRNEVAMFGTIIPAKEVGGDLYDFFIRDEKLFFCIGDVSGKGVPASLLMTVTRCLFRTVSSHEDNPGKIVSILNNSMSDMNESSMFVTLFVGALDLKTGRLNYCNAGHCAPVLIENGNIAQISVKSNIPIGVMMNWKYEPQSIDIHPSGILYMYTDGLTEAENIEHQLFGENRMLQTIGKSELSTHSLVDDTIEAVRAFADGADQSDDLTVLVVHFTEYLVDGASSKTITFSNDVSEISRLAEFIESCAEDWNLPVSEVMGINLALEEVVVNVMNYAYPENTKGDVTVIATHNSDGLLTFKVLDQGKPFDPTKVAEPDLTLSAEERPIGGLGIHLVKQIMDEISYQYEEQKNVLTLSKKI